MAVCALCAPLTHSLSAKGGKRDSGRGGGTLFADFKARSSSTVLVVKFTRNPTDEIIFVFILESGLAS